MFLLLSKDQTLIFYLILRYFLKLAYCQFEYVIGQEQLPDYLQQMCGISDVSRATQVTDEALGHQTDSDCQNHIRNDDAGDGSSDLGMLIGSSMSATGVAMNIKEENDTQNVDLQIGNQNIVESNNVIVKVESSVSDDDVLIGNCMSAESNGVNIEDTNDIQDIDLRIGSPLAAECNNVKEEMSVLDVDMLSGNSMNIESNNKIIKEENYIQNVGMLIDKSIIAESNSMKVKEENGFQNSELQIERPMVPKCSSKKTELDNGIRYSTSIEKSVVSSTSQIVPNNHSVKVPNVSSNAMENSYYSLLLSNLSCLANSNTKSHNTLETSKSPGPLKSKTASSFSSCLDSGSIKMGIRCVHCEKLFSNKNDFESHVPNGNCQWKCWSCKKVFDYSKYKARQQSQHYLEFKDNVERHKRECDCTCQLCGYSSIERTNVLRHIKYRHSNSKKHVCDICYITFNSENKLNLHKANEHTGEAGIYHCPQCPMKYPILQMLKTHLKSSHLKYTKRPKIACNICGKKYDIHTLKRHEITHKTKDITCDRCPATFKSAECLKLHQRRHDKAYSHYCEACGKGFYNSHNLGVHRRVHTKAKPYFCTLCDYSCNVKGNLDKHMKRHEEWSNGKQKT